VPLASHLTEADIRRYVAGIRSEQTERHVRLCIFCMHRLAEAAQRETRWERRGLLGRLVRIEPSQTVDELMAEIEDELRHHAA
jgi:DNA-binding transcriptional regulator PaaX